jgi:hypothetical protein
MSTPKKTKRPAAKKKKKAPVRKASKPRRPTLPQIPKTSVWDITPDQQIVGAVLLGKVKNYLPQIRVATLVLEAHVAIGDSVRVKGHTTDLTQRVEHMEVGHQTVQSASPGEAVGLQVADKVREGDAVYKL